MTAGRWVLLIFVLLLGGTFALFYIQNAETQVDVIFRLPMLGAWHLPQGLPLPLLLGIASGSGFALGAGFFGIRSMSRGRKAKSLERKLSSLQEEVDFARRGSGSYSSEVDDLL